MSSTPGKLLLVLNAPDVLPRVEPHSTLTLLRWYHWQCCRRPLLRRQQSCHDSPTQGRARTRRERGAARLEPARAAGLSKDATSSQRSGRFMSAPNSWGGR